MSAEEPKRRYVDTTTRTPGVFARHRLSCELAIGGDSCTCKPSYWAKAWDPEIGRHRKTRLHSSIGAAKNERDDLRRALRDGTFVEKVASVRFEKGVEQFIADCKSGVVLNKQGKPYTRKAIINLESSLRRVPAPLRLKKVDAIRDGEVQRMVDDFRRGSAPLSSSRLRSIVNALRSFYTWAVAHELATSSPAASVRLPADDSKERDRVATPGEFARLLDQLEPADALPWALAAYGTARSQEIRALEWPEVDFEGDVILLADDEETQKSKAARRLVPMVRPLRRRLYAEWVRQGRPNGGKVCPPRKHSPSGMVSLDQMQKRIVRLWREAKLKPILLQESRHTAATWLDHAGVSPKVASVFMGHKAPNKRLHADAAPITLRRYTHILDGELERARVLLDAFLIEREELEQRHEFDIPAET